MVFPMMFCLTLLRTLVLTLTLSYLKHYGLIATLIGLALILGISLFWYSKYDVQIALIGAISSIFGPCMILDEYTWFFLNHGMLSTMFFIAQIIALPILIGHDMTWKFSFNETSNFKNASIWSLTFDTDIPIFQNETEANLPITQFLQEQPFVIYSLLALGLFSICAVWAMHSLLDDTSKLGLHLARWEEDDKLWLPFIKRLKKADTLEEPEDYNTINEDAEKELGLSLLEFSLSTGRLAITKVCLLMACAKLVCRLCT